MRQNLSVLDSVGVHLRKAVGLLWSHQCAHQDIFALLSFIQIPPLPFLSSTFPFFLNFPVQTPGCTFPPIFLPASSIPNIVQFLQRCWEWDEVGLGSTLNLGLLLGCECFAYFPGHLELSTRRPCFSEGGNKTYLISGTSEQSTFALQTYARLSFGIFYCFICPYFSIKYLLGKYPTWTSWIKAKEILHAVVVRMFLETIRGPRGTTIYLENSNSLLATGSKVVRSNCESGTVVTFCAFITQDDSLHAASLHTWYLIYFLKSISNWRSPRMSVRLCRLCILVEQT